MSEPQAPGLPFRRDIEGLRAVAILLVVAAHAGVPWLEGGFIGVDLFFVLSGYLISGLLLAEIRGSGRVAMLAFYSRRLKRLLPALLLMLLVTATVSALLMAPFEQPPQARAGFWASAWLSNLYFAFSRLDYFGASAESNLFLHTWSLGVEEQFYLVWPALVMFLLAAFTWQGARHDSRRLIMGMATVFAVSLGLELFLARVQPLWSFYLMPARAWQFALGALALLCQHRLSAAARQVPYAVVEAASLLGLGLIAISAVLLDRHTPYPGTWALLPSLGTALLLAGGALNPRSTTARFLAIAPMQWVGRVSYAWYLWHWPVLLLGASLVVDGARPPPLLLIAISLLLAVLSYFTVERPIRRHPTLTRRTVATLTAGLLLMAGSVGLAAEWQRLATRWLDSPGQARYQQVRSSLPVIYAMGCDEWFHRSRVRVCTFGDENAEQTAVLLGDSTAGQWFPALASAYAKPGWRLIVVTKSACPMVDETFYYQRIGRDYVVCTAWREAAVPAVAALAPDVVFLGSSVDYPFTRSQWIEGSKRILDQLAGAAGEVFIIRASARLPFDGPNCLARRDWRRATLALDDTCSAPAKERKSRQIHEWLGMAAEDFSNVRILDLNPVICPGKKCRAEVGGEIVFRDRNHVAARYVESLAQAFVGVMAGSRAMH